MTDGTTRIRGDDPRDFLDWRPGSGRTVEIFDIAVNSGRGLGRGRALVRRLVELVESWEPLASPPARRLIFAVTRSTNQIAQQFYEALNFRVVAVLREFYQDDPGAPTGVDAIMYGYDVNSNRQKSL